MNFSPITTEEWAEPCLTPDVIVENYLYADVGLLVAPGGVGKTTLVLYEAIHVALGLPLYGRAVRRPGPVVIVSAEDSREQLIARAHALADGMRLTSKQCKQVHGNLVIVYVDSHNFKLCMNDGTRITIPPDVDNVIEKVAPLKPSLMVFDPVVSFGAGESLINDAEHGLILAARRIRDALNCCVRLVHHTGKGNARKGSMDQYSGRGGSALADGARMVATLRQMEPGEWQKKTGKELSDNAVGLQMALPKMSYTSAQGAIYIKREGFLFDHISGPEKDDRKLITFLKANAEKGVFFSLSTLEQARANIGLSRDDLRCAIARLKKAGTIQNCNKLHSGPSNKLHLA